LGRVGNLPYREARKGDGQATPTLCIRVEMLEAIQIERMTGYRTCGMGFFLVLDLT
jgi:hypothetical protein